MHATHPPIQARQVTRYPTFCLATMPSRHGGGFMAWAKMGDILGMDPIEEPGIHVRVRWGQTRDEARDLLLEEIGEFGFIG